jgi:putative flippase GtrA
VHAPHLPNTTLETFEQNSVFTGCMACHNTARKTDLIDTATVYAVRGSLGLYGAGLAGYVTAATGNWLLNWVWTFRGRGYGPAHRQWAMFMVINLAGFVLNRGSYALLVMTIAMAARQPVIAIAVGAVVGMFVNFGLSR